MCDPICCLLCLALSASDQSSDERITYTDAPFQRYARGGKVFLKWGHLVFTARPSTVPWKASRDCGTSHGVNCALLSHLVQVAKEDERDAILFFVDNDERKVLRIPWRNGQEVTWVHQQGEVSLGERFMVYDSKKGMLSDLIDPIRL